MKTNKSLLVWLAIFVALSVVMSLFSGEVSTAGAEKIAFSDFMTKDETKIKWVQNLIGFAEKGQNIAFDKEEIRETLYRPFQKQVSYFSKEMNWSRYLQPKLFPLHTSHNIYINFGKYTECINI